MPLSTNPIRSSNDAPGREPVATDKVRYVGDAVAVIAATSRGAAEDAAELVEVEYDVLPAVVDVEAALADGAPIVHEEFGTNRCYTWNLDAGEVDRLFAEAAVTVGQRYRPKPLDPDCDRAARRSCHPVPARASSRSGRRRNPPHPRVR